MSISKIRELKIRLDGVMEERRRWLDALQIFSNNPDQFRSSDVPPLIYEALAPIADLIESPVRGNTPNQDSTAGLNDDMPRIERRRIILTD